MDSIKRLLVRCLWNLLAYLIIQIKFALGMGNTLKQKIALIRTQFAAEIPEFVDNYGYNDEYFQFE